VSWRRGILGARVALVAAGLVAGCVVAGPNDPGPPQMIRSYPGGCADFTFAPARCDAIVAIARNRLGIADPAAAVELLSEGPLVCPTDEVTGQQLLCKRSGYIGVIVRITPPDAPSQTTDFYCGVGSIYSVGCTDTPTVLLRTPMEGYRDIACSEDASGQRSCATPLPAVEASATEAARPLTLARLDIPIDHLGPYEVKAGTAGLPNGILGTATFQLADPFPASVLIDEEGVFMAIRPTDPSHPPFDNYYQHGWYPGVEDADVFLVFDVVWHDTSAVLPIRDLVVR
jgi:hypothetical protein